MAASTAVKSNEAGNPAVRRFSTPDVWSRRVNFALELMEASHGPAPSGLGRNIEGNCSAFNAHDLDTIMEFFADECSLDMPRGPEPWGQRFVGKAAVREGLATRFKGLPDVHYSDDRHWASGNMGVSEWLLTGTTGGAPSPGARMRPLGVSRREGRSEGLVLEDR